MGMPLTSRTLSPSWTEDSRSGLRTVGSNLKQRDGDKQNRKSTLKVRFYDFHCHVRQ